MAENLTGNLVEKTMEEIERNRELLAAYKMIPTGAFGAMVIERKIERAVSAISSGDVVEILASYQELKTSE